MVALVIAIARPQASREMVRPKSEGMDIMLLLDTSESMRSTDFPPNRLEVAKKTASQFIEGRKSDRMGIILFAENALNYAPLTSDRAMLQEMIKDIKSNIMPQRGTALGTAVAVGINRMRSSESASRVMILLTDGAHNRGQLDPISAAKLARRHGIRLYCIGIGSGRDVGLDEQSLRKMAQLGNGRYFLANNEAMLGDIFQDISQLEKSVINQNPLRQTIDHYPIFLKAAIILMGLAFLLMLSFMYNPLEQ